ncbi:MAG: NAD(P)/FAD-dependent oxidoreductase [Longimicrobiales bacterium]
MTDYIIVGGGVYGCATAWHLARQGASVVLFEASAAASGASGGLGERGVRANGRDVRELPLIRRSHEIWPDLADELSGPTGFRRIGHLLLAENEEDFGRLEAQCALQTEHGLPSEVLHGAHVAELEPGVHDQVQRALLCPDDGVADHTTTTRSWARAAANEGVDIRDASPVESVWLEDDSVKGVNTRAGGSQSARRGVILLANTSVGPLMRRAWGVQLPIWPVVPQAILTEPSSDEFVTHLVGHVSRRLSVKSLPDGRVMLSGGWRGKWDPLSGEGEVIQSALAGNWEEATTVFPAIAGLAIQQAVSDRPESMCIDGVPIIDRLDTDVPVWFGTGWTGHGWAIAPAVAESLADWILTGVRPGVLVPFGLSRFRTARTGS